MKKYIVKRVFFRNLEVQNPGDVIELDDELEIEKLKFVGYIDDYVAPKPKPKRRSTKRKAKSNA